MIKKSQKGFTLIELLVVIAVIAILAVLIIIRIGSAQADARDAVRKQDLANIQTALERYKIENSKYPVEAQDNNCSYNVNDIQRTSCILCAPPNRFTDALRPYLPKMPTDPSYPETECLYERQYLYRSPNGSGNQSYSLFAHMEDPANANGNHLACCTTEYANYKVTN